MKAGTARDLLVLAIQDLHDGERAWQERIAELRSHIADEDLASFAGRQAELSAGQAARLEKIADDLKVAAQAAENIWLRAILDDARRDTEMIERGPLLDTALIGAMRKGIESERVSYETAIHVAVAIGMAEAAALLEQTHGEELAADARLAALIQRIAADTA